MTVPIESTTVRADTLMPLADCPLAVDIAATTNNNVANTRCFIAEVPSFGVSEYIRATLSR
jgi:hypothetical protein